MADLKEKKPSGGDVTDSIANPQTSDNGSELSWRQFFDNEKYRHHLMLVKTKQYSELLSVIRQGYVISDPYKPPIELPSPEETFPPSDHADDNITISQSGLSLDFSNRSTYPTLSTQSTYSTQNSTQNAKHNQRLTLALVMFGLIILIAMSVTVGVVLHVHLDKGESPVPTIHTHDVIKLDGNSSSHQQSSTEASGQQSSTPSSTQWLASSFLQNPEPQPSRRPPWSLINSLSAQPMSISSQSRPPNQRILKASTLTSPGLSTPSLPASFVPAPQYSPPALPKYPLSSLDIIIKSSPATDFTTLLPQMLLQPTTPPVTKLSVLLQTQTLLPQILLQPTTPPVTKLSLLLQTQWSKLSSSDTSASSFLSSTKQPLSHMTLSSQTRSPGSVLPALPVSKTLSTGEAHMLTSYILSNLHMQEIVNQNQLVNPLDTGSLTHLFDSFLSRLSKTSIQQMFPTTVIGLSPSSMSKHRPAVSRSSIDTTRTTATSVTPTLSFLETSTLLKSQTGMVYNSQNPNFQKQSIVNGSSIATHYGQPHSPGQQPHLNDYKTPSSGSFDPSLQQLQLNPFKIPTSSGPVILTYSDSLQRYLHAPVQSGWTQTTTNASPLTLYSPSQISGPAKLSHPSSDGSHNYMSKLTFPVTATQKDTTGLKSGISSNTTSHIAYEKTQFMREISDHHITFSKIKATPSLVDTAADKQIKEVFATTERTRQATVPTITLLFPNGRRVPTVEDVHEAIPSPVLSQFQDKSQFSVGSTTAKISKLRERTSFPFAFASTVSPLAPSELSINKNEDNKDRINDDKSINMKRSNISYDNSSSKFENPHTLKSSLDRLLNRQDGPVALDTKSFIDLKRNVTFQTELSRLGKYTHTLVNTLSPETLTATAAYISSETPTGRARDIAQTKKAMNNPATNISSSLLEIKEEGSDGDNLNGDNFSSHHPTAGTESKNNNAGSNTRHIQWKLTAVGIHVTMATETTRQHLMSDISHTLSSGKADATATSRDNVTASSREGMPNTNTEIVDSYEKMRGNTIHRTGISGETDITRSSMFGMDLSNSRVKFTNTTGNTKDSPRDVVTPNPRFASLHKIHNINIAYRNNKTSYGSIRFHSEPNDIKVSPTLDRSAPLEGIDISKIVRGSSSAPSRTTISPSGDIKSPPMLSPPSPSVAGAQNQTASANRKLMLETLNQTSVSNLQSAEASDQLSMGTLNGHSMKTHDTHFFSIGKLYQQAHGTSNQQSYGTSNQQSRGTSNQQLHRTSNQQLHGKSNEHLHGTSNQQLHGTSNQQSHGTSNQQSHGTSHQKLHRTSNQQSHRTSNQQSHGTSNQQSRGKSNQQLQRTSNQQSHRTSNQQSNGTSNQHSSGSSNHMSNITSNQQSHETSNQQSHGTSNQNTIWSSNHTSNRTSNQQSLGTSNQQSHETSNQQSDGTSNQQSRGTSNQNTIGSLNHTSNRTSNQQSLGTSNQQSHETSNQLSRGTSNHDSNGSSNQTSNGTSNQHSLEKLNWQPLKLSKQYAIGSLDYQVRRRLNHTTLTTPGQQFKKAGNNESTKKSNLQSQRTFSPHSTGAPDQHSKGSLNKKSMGPTDQQYHQSMETANKLLGDKPKVPSTEEMLNKSRPVATSKKATIKTRVTVNPNEDETEASTTKSRISETLQTPKAIAGPTSRTRYKATLSDSQSESAVTSFRQHKDTRIQQINASTDEPLVSMNTSSVQNVAVSTTTATTTTTTPATTTTLDPYASFQGVGNPDGGSMSLSALDSGLKKEELNSGVLLDYTLLLQNLPPPEVFPKAIATKVAAKPPPIPTVAPPPTPKPSEINIIAPDVVAEIGMSPTSNLKVVCTAQKAWGWTYIAISRYEGDSEFSLEFLGGVDKSDEWPFIPIDSRMSDFTLHRDDDQVTFALETKYALCEDKGRYLCEIKVNRTFFSKTFNVDVKKRPEKPDLQFPEDVIEGQSVWLVTTWDAGNPVIGYIVHDIVKGFTGLPYASTLESTNAWYKECAVMIENKYSVTPELSWNGTEIVAHILPKDNATVYERSIVERVKYDRKIMTVLDKNICSGHTSVRIGHPYRGDKYITCYSSGPAVSACPNNHIFDEVMQICVRSGLRP